MLTVFNCGQGDAMMMRYRCFDYNPLIIDLGPSTFTFPILPNEIDLLITHSHDDHIKGNFSNKVNIDTLYIPAYFIEVQKILNILREKKRTILRHEKIKYIKILYEGGPFGHSNCTEVLNPPLNPYEIFKKDNIETITNEDVDKLLNEYSTSVSSILKEEIPIGANENIIYDDIPKEDFAKEFVYLAIKIIKKYMDDDSVDSPPKKKINKAIDKFLKYDVNDISVVFKHDCGDLIYLLTGDASINVFNRLIEKGKSIKAHVLKVPHHGSRNSLTQYILMNICPKFAIVSHNNRKFGGDKDTHPHKEVIHILNQQRIPTYYTNDVIKNNFIIIPAHRGLIRHTLVYIR